MKVSGHNKNLSLPSHWVNRIKEEHIHTYVGSKLYKKFEKFITTVRHVIKDPNQLEMLVDTNETWFTHSHTCGSSNTADKNVLN